MSPRVVLCAAVAAAMAGTLVAAAAAATVPVGAAPADATVDGASRTVFLRSPQRLTILQAVGQSRDFSLLAAAVKAAGLAPTLGNATASLTLFAPTDRAFVGLAKTLGWSGAGGKASALAYIVGALKTLSGDGDPTPLLASILKYHVAAGAIRAKALVAAGGYTPLAGPRVRLSGDGKRLADAALAVADPALLRTDRVFRNGIVHVLSGVLLPLPVGAKKRAGAKPAASPPPPPANKTIAQVAAGTPSLSILVQALAAADLVKVVANAGASLTVFAPSNAAFLALARDLGYGSARMDGVFPFLVQALTVLGKGDPGPLLKVIITYHVLPTKKGSAALLGRGNQQTIQGGSLRVTPTGEVVDLAPAVANGKITAANVAASNGVVHRVSRVLLPLNVCPASAGRRCAARGGFLNARTCRCFRLRRYAKGH